MNSNQIIELLALFREGKEYKDLSLKLLELFLFLENEEDKNKDRKESLGNICNFALKQERFSQEILSRMILWHNWDNLSFLRKNDIFSRVRKLRDSYHAQGLFPEKIITRDYINELLHIAPDMVILGRVATARKHPVWIRSYQKRYWWQYFDFKDGFHLPQNPKVIQLNQAVDRYVKMVGEEGDVSEDSLREAFELIESFFDTDG